jgi:hypothetical protein
VPDTGWKWYLTPSIGNMGAAVEVEQYDSDTQPICTRKVRKVALVIINERGEVGFMPWVPIKVSMCDPEGSITVDSLALFEASVPATRALNDLWNGEKSRIIRPPMNGPRIVP